MGKDMLVYRSADRKDWIDVYKGIMIILVVVGHATGVFNLWIYQFHMAAFFFISGYLSKVEEKNNTAFVINRILTIVCPFLTLSLAGYCINAFINKSGHYEFLFGTPFIGIKNSIVELLINGNNNAQYLGTFWFLATLFGVELLHAGLSRLCDGLNLCDVLISVFIYGMGCYCALSHTRFKIGILDISIIFIAQIYYILGAFAQKHLSGYVQSHYDTSVLICVVLDIVIVSWGIMNDIIMDLAVCRVDFPIASVPVALSSIDVMMILSRLIAKHTIWIKKSLEILGKNSLGIMVFHFFFFKLCFLFYYRLGMLTRSEVGAVVLPAGTPTRLWVPMAIISLLGSLIIWIIITRIRALRIILGQDRLWNHRVVSFLTRRSTK